MPIPSERDPLFARTAAKADNGALYAREPTAMSKILYTLTDEAPYLATQSLLPIVEAFTRLSPAPKDF